MFGSYVTAQMNKRCGHAEKNDLCSTFFKSIWIYIDCLGLQLSRLNHFLYSLNLILPYFMHIHVFKGHFWWKICVSRIRYPRPRAKLCIFRNEQKWIWLKIVHNQRIKCVFVLVLLEYTELASIHSFLSCSRFGINIFMFLFSFWSNFIHFLWFKRSRQNALSKMICK